MNYQGAFFNTNDYELTKECLGHGAFGTVYVAKSKKDDTNYAIKIIKTEGGFNGDQQMQLMRESMILRELHHPSIVQFIGINFQSFNDPNKLEPSIITEYLPNGSLKDILDKEKRSLAVSDWTPTKKYISLLGIANAMKYLHQKKIIHRDLKPQNILMDCNFYPRVCDFGLSRCLPDSYSKSMDNAMTSDIGTPLYMSPELLRGEAEYDSSVDVYAFGILAYEIVTGKEPYYELGPKVSRFVLANKVMSGYRPIFSNETTEKMIGLITKCWSDNVTERPSFDEIYNLLSNDFTYFDESIDHDEVNEYIDNSFSDCVKNCSYDADDYFFRALSLLHSRDKEKNLKEAVSILYKASERGSSLSSFLLGLMHNDGEIDNNFEKAEFYLRRATEQGNSNGLNQLGVCYSKGIGVDVDHSKAFSCFQKSAELGNFRAMFNLGNCYKWGEGVEKDDSKAFELMQNSAEQGNAAALHNLAICYERGQGVEQNINKAIECYEKAGSLGHSGALHNLGNMYDKGKFVEQNYTKAIECYEKACELGHSSSLCNLGLIYKRGNGVETNYEKAIDCFQKACELGHARAYHNLGIMYEKGLGVQQDKAKAIELYEKSVELGHPDSQKNIDKLKG
ncbi:hypothetical protein M9Y10_018697 [Tritrichomonas musculus]|uniref:Protein kinase domain-containing protein n=1 Tax=Tritrichomonas musculus TaxID=1915356 RepID=A0ABR2HMD4_9EUKA